MHNIHARLLRLRTQNHFQTGKKTKNQGPGKRQARVERSYTDFIAAQKIPPAAALTAERLIYRRILRQLQLLLLLLLLLFLLLCFCYYYSRYSCYRHYSAVYCCYWCYG